MTSSQTGPWRYLATVGAIAIAYFVAAKLALQLLNLGAEASPVWPPAGIALAALVLGGRRYWPGIALGAFWLNLALGVWWIVNLGSVLGTTLQALVAATLLYQWRFRPTLDRLRDVFGFIVLAALIATTVNATMGSLMACLSGFKDWSQFGQNWATVWLGDSTGILVVTPFLLVIKTRFSGQVPRRQVLEGLLWLVLVLIVSWSVFHGDIGRSVAQYPLEYLPLPFVIGAAIRLGQPGAVFSSFLVSCIAIWASVQGVGPFVVKASTLSQVVSLQQAFLSVTTITALVLAAAVTENRQIQALLRRSEASLANAQRIARIGHWDFDFVPPQWRWSDELYRLLGVLPQAFTPSQDSLLQAVHPEDRERVRGAIATALWDGTPYSLEYRIVLPTGEERTVFEQTAVRPHGLTGTIQDITARKQAEAALQDSELQNRALLDAIPDLILRIHRNGTCLDFRGEKTSTDSLQTSCEDVVGQNLRDCLPQEVADLGLQAIATALETGLPQTCEYQLLNPDGWHHYETRVVACSPNETLAIIRDITDRKQSEENLRLSAERDRLLGEMASKIRRSLDLQEILETTVTEVRQFLQADRVFISCFNPDGMGRVVAESVGSEWASSLGWTTDSIVYEELQELLPQGQIRVICDSSQLKVSPFLSKYYEQYQVQAGIGVPIFLNQRLFAILIVNQCSKPRQWHTIEIDLLTQLSNQVAIALQQADLYHQVQALNANLEQQVEDRTKELQQKMKELEELSHLRDVFLHAVSHDLRTTVMGTLLVLKNLQNQQGEMVFLARPILEKMVCCAEQQLGKLNSLSEAYTSKTQGVVLHCEKLPLATLVQSVLEDLEPLVTKNQAVLHNQIPAKLPLIMADPTQLRRVFENLLINALKHNPPGVMLTLDATVEHGEMLCSIQDNGTGIKSEKCDRLFELRIDSGPQSRQLTGISLGLYLCRQIVAAHGGHIGVHSCWGEGTKFWFTIPLAHDNVSSGCPRSAD